MSINIRNRFLNSIKWTGGYSIFQAVSSPVYIIILGQLLAPDEFAYIAVIALVLGFAGLVSSFGLSEALIQKEDIDNDDISIIFTFDLIKSIILTSIFIVGAPVIERLYSLENVIEIVRMVSVIIVFSGSSSVFRSLLQKELHFKEFSLINFYKTLSDMLVTVTFLLLGYGVYGYVFGTVFSNISYSILIIYFSIKKTKTKVRILFNMNRLKTFFNFGFFVGAKTFITYLSNHIDELIIGNVLGQEVLGVYYFGKNLIKQSQVVITSIFAQVLFPTFSLLKKDVERLKSIYLRITRIVASIAFPLYIGIALTAHLFVPILFGDEWIGLPTVIRYFSVAGIFLLLTSNIASSLLYALNKPKTVFITNFIMISLYFLALLFFNIDSLQIVLILYILHIIFKAIILQITVLRSLKITTKEYFNTILVSVFGTLIMSFIIFGISFLGVYPNLLIRFLSISVTGASIYVLFSILIHKVLVIEVKSLIQKNHKI